MKPAWKGKQASSDQELINLFYDARIDYVGSKPSLQYLIPRYNSEHAQDIANGVITVATNEKIDITNLVDTVRDNTSATKLKDYLTQTKDGQQILAGLQADPASQEEKGDRLLFEV